MNILIVSQYFWPENFRVNDLAASLHERGHRVTVLTGQPNYPSGRYFSGHGYTGPWRQKHAGIDILRCPLIPRGNGGKIRLALNYLSFVVSTCLLAPFRCRGKFDAIFVYAPSPITVTLPALLLRALGRGPVLLWVLDLWPESISAAAGVRGPALMGVISSLVRFIYRRCDRVLVQSRAFIERVQNLGAQASQIRYLPSWAEGVFVHGTAHDGAGLPPLPSGFRVLFAGNVGAAQDFPGILLAAERLASCADIHWIIIGDGRMAAWVREEIAARRLTQQMHMLGSFPVENMPSFYAQADCLLVTLKREPIFALTIPGKIQSYLASGRPIVAMLDGEGARIVVEAGAGFAGPAEEPKLLADNVLSLYRMSAAERERMGLTAREYYKAHFERERLIDELEAWMRETAAARV
jgi:colanic acid biosynthesis glycosyl transferase WcaI